MVTTAGETPHTPTPAGGAGVVSTTVVATSPISHVYDPKSGMVRMNILRLQQAVAELCGVEGSYAVASAVATLIEEGKDDDSSDTEHSADGMLLEIEMPRSLPSVFTRRLHELEWAKDIPGEGFRLELGRLPELHRLGLIAQNASIPAAYLHNRYLLGRYSGGKRVKRLRQHHREVLESIVDKLMKYFFSSST